MTTEPPGPVSEAGDEECPPGEPVAAATPERFSRVASLSAWIMRFLTLPLRAFKRFNHINGKTRALALAGQAFISIIPLMIVLASIGGEAKDANRVGRSIVSRFHLEGTAAEAVHGLFARPPGASGAIGIFGIIILLLALLNLTKALQKTYEAAWGLGPSKGVKAALNGLSGMSLLLAELIVLAFLVSALARVPGGSFFTILIRLVLSFGCWLVLQRLLLLKRVAWRQLVPSAIVATVGQLLLSFFSAVYMPHIISKDAGRYGFVGVTFALLSWLIIICTAIVLEATFGAELGGASPVRPEAAEV